MMVKRGPGVFTIVDYDTMRFFFGYSTDNMIDVVRRNFWQVEHQQHTSEELNLAYIHGHELGYHSLLNFVKGTAREKIIEKRNHLIRALDTYQPARGFNSFSYLSIPSEKEGNRGIYAIIVYQKKTTRRKFYIGLAKDIVKRIEAHKYYLQKSTHQNSRLQEDFDKGLIFIFRPLTTFSSKEMSYSQLKELEVKFIYIFRTYLKDYGYNTNANGLFFHTKESY